MKLEDLLIPPNVKLEVAAPTGIVDTNTKVNDTPAKNTSPTLVEIPDYLINDPQVMGYPDAEMQDSIYEFVATHIRNQQEYLVMQDEIDSYDYCSLLDLGCGRGDFLPFVNSYLENSDWCKLGGYLGIDNNEIYIDIANQKNQRYIRDSYNFKNGDILTLTQLDIPIKYDYTVLIGTLNSMNLGGNSKAKMFREIMEQCFKFTSRQIIMVLCADFDDLEGYNDWPYSDVISWLPSDHPFEIKCHKEFKDIYMLVVDIDEFTN